MEKHVLTKAENATGGRNGRTHGVRSMKDNPLSKWPEPERLLVTELADELRTPELVEEHMRFRAAQGLVILQVLETYVAQEMAAGVPLDELAILGRWPAFQNSTLRALQAVKAIADEKPDPDALITLEDLDD